MHFKPGNNIWHGPFTVLCMILVVFSTKFVTRARDFDQPGFYTMFLAITMYGLTCLYDKERKIFITIDNINRRIVRRNIALNGKWIKDLIIISMLISVLAFSYRNNTNEYSIRSFAYIFLAGYAGFIFSQLDFYFFHTGIEKNYDPLILLLINFCPFFWLKFYFTKQNLSPSTMERMEGIFNRLCRKYNISKREKEIIELILSGKSNREIEDALFISFNTVKNHIYNIYQKFGVQSRSQLIHHINRHYIDEE